MLEGLMNWDLQPGDTIRRVELHRRLAGGGQGGINPSTKTPNVLIFSDPARGAAHGYIDDWRDDGLFHYTGEGQRGDQQMRAGNKAILQHREDDRALCVFRGVGGGSDLPRTIRSSDRPTLILYGRSREWPS
jgi:hypothetical protein